jgi:hypothetical protein
VSESYDSLTVLFGEIESFTTRLTVHTRSDVPDSLKVVLAKILASVIRVCALSAKLMAEGRALQFVKNLLRGNDGKVQAELTEIQRLVGREQSLVGALTLERSGNVRDLTKEIKSLLTQYRGEIEEQLKHLLQDHESSNILEWLSPLEFATEQDKQFAYCQPGTGRWFLESEAFNTWLDTPSQTLFCPGIPGAGKTVLSSLVVDHLLWRLQNPDVAIAYIYCDYGNDVEHTPLNLLGSILKQLVYSGPDVSRVVKDVYHHRIKKNARMKLTEVSSLLHIEAARYSRVYVIVDALDECSDRNGVRRTLLESLLHLRETSAVNLMVTSRFIPAIEERFSSMTSMTRLDIRAQDEDVASYVSASMQDLTQCVEGNLPLQDAIVTAIMNNAQGM